MEIVFWLIVGLLIGGVIGGLATWWVSRARGGAVSVMQLKQENDKFKNEVTEHFVETARLINQMTDSYKQVFDHLSSGAEKLVDEKSLAERLPPASGREVKLSQFGASTTAGNTTEGGSDQARSRPGSSDRSSSTDGAVKAVESTDSTHSESVDPLKSRSEESRSERTGSAHGEQSAPITQSETDKDSGSASGDDASASSDTARSEEARQNSDQKSGASGSDQDAGKSRTKD